MPRPHGVPVRGRRSPVPIDDQVSNARRKIVALCPATAFGRFGAGWDISRGFSGLSASTEFSRLLACSLRLLWTASFLCGRNFDHRPDSIPGTAPAHGRSPRGATCLDIAPRTARGGSRNGRGSRPVPCGECGRPLVELLASAAGARARVALCRGVSGLDGDRRSALAAHLDTLKITLRIDADFFRRRSYLRRAPMCAHVVR